jgi:uncharacterized protein YjiS (DUF1127 family)
MIHRISETVLNWRARSRECRILLELDDCMLRDFGVARAGATAKRRRTFWRA